MHRPSLAPPLGIPAKFPIWPHFFMALYGAGWAVALDVGVRLYGAEIIALAGLLIVPWPATLKRYPMARHILGAYTVWVLAILVADSVNGTALLDSAKTIATPILGGLSLLVVLASVSCNPKAVLTFLAATVVAKWLLGEPSYGDAFADMVVSFESVRQNTNFFKVRIDPFLTPGVVLVACLLGRRGLLRAAAVFGIACVAYFAVDSRATGLIFFLTALVLVAIHFRIRPKLSQAIIVSVVALFVGYGAYVGYINYTLKHNPDGHNGKQIARMENPYDPIELLLHGRSEWLVMGTAIAERPFFGWGSWAIDIENRFVYLRSERTGVFDYAAIERRDFHYIPVHSVVGSAWIWSGLLGFVAIAWLFLAAMTAIIRLPYANSIALPFAVFFAIQVVWHLFFSPPQVVRLSFPVPLAAIIVNGD